MNTLWDWSTVCSAVGADVVDGPAITGVSIDSRTLVPGDLFIALVGNPGKRFNTSHKSSLDGHNYVKQALDAGAAGVVVHDPKTTSIVNDGHVILVEDTLDALWDLARASRKRMHCPVFAITGSSGKTTLRNFLGACLSLEVAAGSLNNFWGVPLSMARTPQHTKAAIFELGTSSPGEIAPLANLVQPHIAVVLNVFPAHIEFFSDLSAIRKEKLSISTALGPDGVLVVPANLVEHAKANRVISFGREAYADIRLLEYKAGEQTARLGFGNDSLEIGVPGGGEHRALTAAATLACIIASNGDPTSLSRLSDIQPPAGRGNRRFAGGIQIIDDSYNANPASMVAALRSLNKNTAGRNFAILGDMLELGEDAEQFHAELITECAGYDGIFCVGNCMLALYQLLPAQQRWGSANASTEIDLATIQKKLVKGDTVLVKGSNRTFWAHGFVEKLLNALEKGQTR